MTWVGYCPCGAKVVCEPGDEHGPVTRLLEHRGTWMHGFVPVGRRYRMQPPAGFELAMRRLELWWLPRPGSSHGTVSRYTGKRCRCPECREAMAAYGRRRRALRRETFREVA
jgi:hypothetical protein